MSQGKIISVQYFKIIGTQGNGDMRHQEMKSYKIFSSLGSFSYHAEKT